MLGQYAGIAGLFAASVALSRLAFAMPAQYLPWLGLLPVFLGLKLLIGTREPDRTPPPASGIVAVAAITVANGGDNIGVYVPVFARSDAAELGVTGGVFAVLTGLWCLAAGWLVRHPHAGAALRRHGPKVVPYALIAIGLWILLGP